MKKLSSLYQALPKSSIALAGLFALCAPSSADAQSLRKPVNVRVVPISSYEVKLTWTDRAVGETGYEVSRGTSTKESSFDVIANIAADSTEFIDHGVWPNSKYYYRVRVSSGELKSRYSSRRRVKTPFPANGPFLVEGLQSNHDFEINPGEAISVRFAVVPPRGTTWRNVELAVDILNELGAVESNYSFSSSQISSASLLQIGQYQLPSTTEADDYVTFRGRLKYMLDGEIISQEFEGQKRVLHSCKGDSPFEAGDGSTASPFQICKAFQLQNLSQESGLWNLSFKLTRDIDMRRLDMLPIGNNPIRFRGNFDGNGFTISNLHILKSSSNEIGLFGYLSGAEVRDLNLRGGVRVGFDWVGAVAGRMENSAVSNVHSTELVSGRDYVGGLVGTLDRSVVYASTATAPQATGQYVGGAVGFQYYGNVQQTFTNGQLLEGNNTVGGVVGYCNSGSIIESGSRIKEVNAFNAGTGGLVGVSVGCGIRDSYSRSNVNGLGFVGGLIGSLAINYGSSQGSVLHCYSTGTLIGGGAIEDYNNFRQASVGFINDASIDPARFVVLFDQETAGTYYNSAATVGLPTYQLKNLYYPSQYYGFSTATWQSDNLNVNDGYPILSWQ